MATGTVYPAKVALKALLEAHSWPTSSPSITWGAPSETGDVTLDLIYMGGVEIADDFRVLGGDRSDESYNLTVGIDVRRYGNDEQATEARAWQLHDEILTLLRANMRLSGAINRITGYRVRQGNPVPGADHWHSQIQIDVACVGYVNY